MAIATARPSKAFARKTCRIRRNACFELFVRQPLGFGFAALEENDGVALGMGKGVARDTLRDLLGRIVQRRLPERSMLYRLRDGMQEGALP